MNRVKKLKNTILESVENLSKAKSHMKASKPSKIEILSELESIRHSLADEATAKKGATPASLDIKSDDGKSGEDFISAPILKKGTDGTNDKALATLPVLDDPTQEGLDEDDIPILDDLVIDDDTCPKAADKIVSQLDSLAETHPVTQTHNETPFVSAIDTGEADTSALIQAIHEATQEEQKKEEEEYLLKIKEHCELIDKPEAEIDSDIEHNPADKQHEDIEHKQIIEESELMENIEVMDDVDVMENPSETSQSNSLAEQRSKPTNSDRMNSASLDNKIKESQIKDTPMQERISDDLLVDDTLVDHTLDEDLIIEDHLIEDHLIEEEPLNNGTFKPTKPTDQEKLNPKLEPAHQYTESLSNIEIATKQIFNSGASTEAAKDNPFLPPHIRERLAKQKRVLADDARAHEFALASLKSSASLLNSASASREAKGFPSHYPAQEIKDQTSTNDNHDNTRKLNNQLENSFPIDTSALVQEILSQSAESFSEALQDAKDGLSLSLAETTEASKPSTNPDSSITNTLLINSLIQQLMPDLEKALRQKLTEQMNNKDTRNE